MRRVTILLALSLSLAPLASAAWSYRGGSEPDNHLDDPSYMWFDPDTSPTGHKVYFSGFQKATPEGDYNANVAAVGSRVLSPVTSASIVLGFWKDCNGDGYVGHVETALLEYRAELLLDDSVCPRTTPSKASLIAGGLYPYNDGTWIRELIWIGPTRAGGAAGSHVDNPTNFYDDGVAAWGDYGLPGGVPTTLCPGGNLGLRSTGAILDYADCATYFRGVRALNDVEAQTGLPVGGWETNDVDNSPSPLNIDNPAYYYLYGPEEPEGHVNEGDYRGFSGGFLGRDDAENNAPRERMVTVVDCESGSLDTSPEVRTPSDATDSSTYPSLYESLNDTYVVVVGGDEDCSPDSAGDEGLPYNAVHPEGYSENTFLDQGRREVDHRFLFWPGNRNVLPATLGGTCRINGNNDIRPGPLGYCPPGDLGLASARHDFAVGGAWRANTITNIYAIYTRESLRTDTPDPGAWYSTYYARLGAKTLGVATPLPGQAARTYGVEACGNAVTAIDGVPDFGNVVNYWNCDQDVWAQRCVDGETTTQDATCYKVGYTYHLRDIDCWDNTLVRGTPTQVGAYLLSNSGPCTDHAAGPGPLG